MQQRTENSVKNRFKSLIYKKRKQLSFGTGAGKASTYSDADIAKLLLNGYPQGKSDTNSIGSLN